jgi:uncharacterized protein
MKTQNMPTAGFHGGELAIQRRAGVDEQAARLAPMLDRAEISSGMARFVSEAAFAAMTYRDRTGRLWTSPLLGTPGFLRSTSPVTLEIDSLLPRADPLHNLYGDQPAGVIIINFQTRRRVRINGILSVGSSQMTVHVNQAYGNCPQYIQQRRLQIDPAVPLDKRVLVHRGDELQANDIRLIEGADTFFLGTAHPTAGSDASHRGGPAGFVRVRPVSLWWSDYPGNNMFNSMGNLATDPAAALLFVDFASGYTLQLSGSAVIVWGESADAGKDACTGRRIRFSLEQMVAAVVPALSATDHVPYPKNPQLP